MDEEYRRNQSNTHKKGIKIYLTPIKDEFYVIKKMVQGRQRKVNMHYCTLDVNDNGSIRKGTKRFKQQSPETEEAFRQAYEYYG